MCLTVQKAVYPCLYSLYDLFNPIILSKEYFNMGLVYTNYTQRGWLSSYVVVGLVIRNFLLDAFLSQYFNPSPVRGQ